MNESQQLLDTLLAIKHHASAFFSGSAKDAKTAGMALLEIEMACNMALIAAQCAAKTSPQGDTHPSVNPLDILRDNSWGLVPFDMPTGQGDADIGWRVLEYHQAKPTERTVAEVYSDDPQAAISKATEATRHG